MVTAVIKYSVLAALAVVTFGCASDNFTVPDDSLNLHHTTPYFNCHIVTGYGTADDVTHGGFTVYPGGIVAARKYGETEFSSEFYLKVEQGNAARIRIRSEDTGLAVTQGLAFTLGKDACSMQEPDMPNMPLPIKLTDDWTRVRILSCAKRVRVIVGCDTVMDEKSDLKLTDYLIFESVDSSVCKIRNFQSEWEE